MICSLRTSIVGQKQQWKCDAVRHFRPHLTMVNSERKYLGLGSVSFNPENRLGVMRLMCNIFC